ncbi:MAG: hypothetical protein ACRBFS_16005 [Aureispira sp.]
MDSFYLKIFDYLDKVEEVDRDKFKQQFQNVKGLSGLQNYLYKLILKSLRNQPAYQDIDAILREGLADLDILYQKELLTEVQEKLQELLQLAQQYNKLFFLPMLYEWWFTLQNAHFHYLNVEPATLARYTKEYGQSIQNLKDYHLYRTELGRSLMLIQEDPKEIFDDVTKIANTLPPYNSNSEEFSLSVRVQELQFRRMLSVLLIDTKMAFFYGKELSSMLKKQSKELFEEYEGFYYRALLSQITYAPTIEQLSATIEAIEQGLLKKTKHLDQRVPMNIFLNKIDVYLLKGEFGAFEEYVEENQHHIDFLMNSAARYLQEFWQIRLMVYYYATKKYSEALIVFEQFLMKKEVSILLKKPSLYLEMIIYYEKEEYLLLASILKNNTRFLRKNNALLDPEKKLITLMTKLIKLPKVEHKAAFVQARIQMMEDLANLEEAQKDFLTYFNYIGWIDSKVTGEPFQQLFFRHTGVIDIGQ